VEARRRAPPGCTASRQIPTTDVGSVRGNDVPAAEAPGVLEIDGHTLRLTSGRYTFTAST
jgi:hypothetical protein